MFADELRKNTDLIAEKSKTNDALLTRLLSTEGLYTGLYFTLVTASKRGQSKVDVEFKLDGVHTAVHVFVDEMDLGLGRLGSVPLTKDEYAAIPEVVDKLIKYLQDEWQVNTTKITDTWFSISW